MRKPQFLCIGAQKAGTTWFYQRLRQHPELWLPPVKEIHYFDTVSLPWRKALTKALRLSERRKGLVHSYWKTPSQWKWIFFPLTDAWYLSLFEEAGERLAGEVTPAYSTLSAGQVARVHRLLPDAKILLLLRDPVERSWSQFRHAWRVGKARIGNTAFRRFFKAPGCTARSHYPQIIQRWETCYPTQQIQVLFFDDLCELPEQLMKTAFKFLGVDPEVRLPGLKLQAHQGVSLNRPDWVTRYLARMYHSDIEWLARRFEGRAAQWLQINQARLYGSQEDRPDPMPTWVTSQQVV